MAQDVFRRPKNVSLKTIIKQKNKNQSWAVPTPFMCEHSEPALVWEGAGLECMGVQGTYEEHTLFCVYV